MAESIVQVTEGSGKKLHTYNRTIGANSVEDEAVFLGEQPYATYNVVAAAVSTATANSHLLQLMAGASLNVYVRRIWASQTNLATTAALLRLSIFRLTTAGTGGTAVTPLPHDTTDAASGAAGMTLPTLKGVEAANQWFIHTVQSIQTVGAGGALLNSSAPFLDFTGSRSKSLRIPAGTTNGIAIKNLDAMAAATLNIVIEFVELNY